MSSGPAAASRNRLRRDLRSIDRRLTARRVLRMLAPGVLMVALFLLVRDVVLAGGDGRLRSLQALLLVAAVAGAGALVLRALRQRDLRRTAAHCDRRAGLDDLLLSAWSLGDRRREVDPHWLELLEERALTQSNQLEGRKIAPLQIPRSAWLGLFLLLVWAGWLAFGADGLLPAGFLTDKLGLGSDPSLEQAELLADMDGAAPPPEGPDAVEPEESPLLLSTRQLTRIDGLTELDLALEGEFSLAEAAAAAGDLEGAPPSGEGAGEGANPEDTSGDSANPAGERDPADPNATGEDILQELGRESATGESPQAGDEAAQARGESPSGDQQARAGGEPQDGEGDPNAPVQEVDFPLAQSAQARESQDGEASQSATTGTPSESGETAQQDATGPMAKNPFGSSTGPQAGEVDPFGTATELEVTLELAILEQQQRERQEPDELTRRASPQKSAEVSRRVIRARGTTEDEVSVLPTITPWRFRGLSQRFFAPGDP